MTARKSVRDWMINALQDDPHFFADSADCLLATAIAEVAADAHDHWEWCDDPDHWVWDVACEAIAVVGVPDGFDFRIP